MAVPELLILPSRPETKPQSLRGGTIPMDDVYRALGAVDLASLDTDRQAPIDTIYAVNSQGGTEPLEANPRQEHSNEQPTKSEKDVSKELGRIGRWAIELGTSPDKNAIRLVRFPKPEPVLSRPKLRVVGEAETLPVEAVSKRARMKEFIGNKARDAKQKYWNVSIERAKANIRERRDDWRNHDYDWAISVGPAAKHNVDVLTTAQKAARVAAAATLIGGLIIARKMGQEHNPQVHHSIAKTAQAIHQGHLKTVVKTVPHHIAHVVKQQAQLLKPKFTFSGKPPMSWDVAHKIATGNETSVLKRAVNLFSKRTGQPSRLLPNGEVQVGNHIMNNPEMAHLDDIIGNIVGA